MQQIIHTLKEKVGGDLISRIGLDKTQADGAIHAAGSSVEEVVTKHSAEPSALLEMFTSGDGVSGAENLLSQLDGNYMSKLTGQLGLDSGKASQVKDLVLPVLMGLLQSKGSGMLASLTGGKAEGLTGGLADKIGGLGKMFGK